MNTIGNYKDRENEKATVNLEGTNYTAIFFIEFGIVKLYAGSNYYNAIVEIILKEVETFKFIDLHYVIIFEMKRSPFFLGLFEYASVYRLVFESSFMYKKYKEYIEIKTLYK